MMEKEAGIHMERFMEVLENQKDKISLLINEQQVEEFTAKVLQRYTELRLQKKE